MRRMVSGPCVDGAQDDELIVAFVQLSLVRQCHFKIPLCMCDRSVRIVNKPTDDQKEFKLIIINSKLN